MDSQVNETKTEASNQTPWNQDFMNMFGFGGDSTQTETAPQEQSGSWFEKIWQQWSPNLYQPPERNDSQFPTRGVRGKGFELDFENVFDRLLTQESRKQHRDKNGKLITSPVGAQGITQIMPATGKKPGYGIKPLQDDSEEEYLRVGKELLQAYTKDLGGDIRKGLAAYNWGIGNVKRAIKKHGDDWEEKLPKETKNYLKKVAGNG